MYQCKYMSLLILIFATLIGIVKCIHWDHSVYLNDDYRMLWTIKGAEITIEVQVKTLGYVGLGFSSNGNLSGADMAIGWIDQGKTYFQVSRFFRKFLCFLTVEIDNISNVKCHLPKIYTNCF